MTHFAPFNSSRLIQRFLYWIDPVPAEHQELAPAFEQETRQIMQRIIPPILLAVGMFTLFFVSSDFLLYRNFFWQLLLLRVILIGLVWGGALLVQWKGERLPIYALFCGCTIIIWMIVQQMLIISQDPTSLYGGALIGGMMLISLLPWPTPWVIFSMLSLNLSYFVINVLAMSNMQTMVAERLFIGIALLMGVPFFCLVHVNTRRQTWTGFFQKQRIQDMATDLQRLNDRLQTELAMAQKIQEGLLPATHPDWPGLDVVGFSIPAREVGGDFFAYHTFSREHVAIAVGDVSGKGLPAALLMNTSIVSFRTTIALVNTPSSLLIALDQAILPYTRTTRLNCALCYAEVRGNTMRVANAGCVMPLLRRGDSSVEWVEVGGMPLGVGFGMNKGYHEATLMLQQGDIVIFTSDGVIEATSASGELFGFERLAETVAQGPGNSAHAMLEYLNSTVNTFVGKSERHDDLTIVVMRLDGAE
jgi:serine phosphatase RsbU (regulator of sigma subunit)